MKPQCTNNLKEKAVEGPSPPYLTPAELASRWRKHPSTIRRMFRDHPGILKFGRPETFRGKREYVELLIPEALVIQMEGGTGRVGR